MLEQVRALFLNDFFFLNFNSTEASCYDINGNKVKHGEPFVPEGNDFCYHCKCLSGQAAQCFTTECAVPTCEDYKAIPGKCCAYTCPSGLFTWRHTL